MPPSTCSRSVAERRWREPATRLPIRWGSYRARYGAGLALVIGGCLLVQSGSVYVPQLMLAGMSAHLVGWWILPGKGIRRAVIALPSLTTVMLILNGAAAMVFLLIPLAGWLWLRQRPARAYLVLVFPAISAYLLTQWFVQYGSGALVLFITGVVIAGSAWLARFLASRMPISGDSPAAIG
jgi:hypothetical protein